MIIIISCSKDDNGIITLPTMNAYIDGEEWVTITRVTVIDNGKFIITGTSASGKTLIITINGTSEGLYEQSLSSVKTGAVYKESVSTTTEDAYISITGEVNLTDVDASKRRISGTFEFSLVRNLTNTIDITDGEFDNLFYTETGGGD